MAHLSKNGQEPVLQRVFIGFDVHRNTGRAHESLSGSNDQTIDNIPRSMRAYSESESTN